jgi:hypothetical protein
MDRNIATERVCPGDFWSVGEEPLPSPRSECKAAVWLSRGEALVLVLLASVGLWAAIWGVIALLAAGEGW